MQSTLKHFALHEHAVEPNVSQVGVAQVVMGPATVAQDATISNGAKSTRAEYAGTTAGAS